MSKKLGIILLIFLGVYLVKMRKVVLSVASGTFEDVVNRFCEAIKKAEGWYSGSWSQKTHNPGNITDLGRPGQVGTATNPASGITFPVFDNDQSGWNALVWKVSRVFSGLSVVYFPTMTISEFFQKYSGDQNEAKNVARDMGVSVDTRLVDLLM